MRLIHHLLGCGLNVLNVQPMTSLAQLRGAAQTDILSIERTAASVISKFESMWSDFTHGEVSFEPFMDLYLKRWIHSFVFMFLLDTCRAYESFIYLFFFRQGSSSDAYHNYTSQAG